MNQITFVLLLLWSSGTTRASAVDLHSPDHVTAVHNDTMGRRESITATYCGVTAIKPKVPACLSDGLGIINGTEAVPNSWPWQASLQTDSGWHFCGGSLISRNWVVTAAHCEISTSHRVILGQHNLKKTSTLQTQSMRIEKVFTHPDYNELNHWDYDMALIKLRRPAQTNKYVSPVCVVNADDHIPAGTKCVVTGWGWTRYDPAQRPDVLQQACLPTISHSQCQNYWGSIQISNQMLCAGAYGAATCRGDSGGPLVCEKNGAWTLHGVTSWGRKGCPTNSPAVFTAVTNLRAWMEWTIFNN